MWIFGFLGLSVAQHQHFLLFADIYVAYRFTICCDGTRSLSPRALFLLVMLACVPFLCNFSQFLLLGWGFLGITGDTQRILLALLSFLPVLWDHMGYLGSNLSLPYSRQIPYLFCYHSVLNFSLFLPSAHIRLISPFLETNVFLKSIC